MSADRRDVREMLRAGDPYDGATIPATDATRIRARIRAAAQERRNAAPSWTLAGAAATCVVLIAVAVWLVTADGTFTSRSDEAPDRLATTEAPGAVAEVQAPAELTAPIVAELVTASEDGRLASARAASLAPAEGAIDVEAPTARHVQLTAPRGTRIIWTLDPAYDNPDSTLNGDEDRFQGADAR